MLTCVLHFVRRNSLCFWILSAKEVSYQRLIEEETFQVI